jgi:hypothetical protein
MFFVLICLFFTQAQTSQNMASLKFNMENSNLLQIQKNLLHSLGVLHQKFNENKFTARDGLLLKVIAECVFQMGDIFNKRRMKEGPVYWYSRKGR